MKTKHATHHVGGDGVCRDCGNETDADGVCRVGELRRKTKLPAISEREFQSQVLALARLRGWRYVHQRPGMTRSGRWATQTQGDIGFPDVVLVHARLKRVIFAELKTDVGKLRPEQQDWLFALEKAGAEVYVWRPENWNAIETILAGTEGVS